jgi:sporulation protein YlmC with PRC-barrel domain
VAAFAAGVFLTAPLLGQVPALPEPPPGEDLFPAEPQPSAAAIEQIWPDRPILASALPPGVEADDLIGREVRSIEDDELGRLRDFVIDLETGQITHAIVGSGGFFGLGETRRVVPMSAFSKQLNGDGSINLDVALSEDDWEQAPRFRDDDLDTLAQEDTRNRIEGHYAGPTGVAADASVQPRDDAPAAEGAEVTVETADSQRRLVLATDLRGLPVLSENTEVGQIDAILVHVNAGDALVRLDPNASTVGTNDQFVLPLTQLYSDGREEEALVTNFQLLDFQRALPQFEGDPLGTAAATE